MCMCCSFDIGEFCVYVCNEQIQFLCSIHFFFEQQQQQRQPVMQALAKFGLKRSKLNAARHTQKSNPVYALFPSVGQAIHAVSRT